MVSTIPISPCIIHPQVKTRINQPQPQTLLLITDNAHTAIDQSMLVNNHWLGHLLPCLGLSESLCPWYPIDSVDIPILGLVDMLLQRIPHLLVDESPQSRDLKTNHYVLLGMLDVVGHVEDVARDTT